MRTTSRVAARPGLGRRLVWLLAAGGACGVENHLQAEEDGPAASVTSPVPSEPDVLDLPGPGVVTVSGSCGLCAPSAAWDVTVEWEVTTHDEGQGFAPPVVGHLDDDDGDGRIGSVRDVPEILFTSTGPSAGSASMSTWLGDGSGPWTAAWSTSAYSTGNAPAVGDLDGDGIPEIVTITAEGWFDVRVQALDRDGTIRWESEPLALDGDSEVGGCQPVITDLEGDGVVEVFCEALLLDGPTGETRARFPREHVWYATTTIADLDLDGVAEIVFGNNVWRADGTQWWGIAPSAGGVFPAALNLDDDPEGEVAFASDGRMSARDTDGTVLWTTQVVADPGAASPPCAADFDGDGQLELAAAFRTEIALFELDGTLVWTRPITDGSTAAGCSGFDFDLDGKAEIAYADEKDFVLFCGADGTRLYADPDHDSGTIYEYPLVVDVDGDGVAEVVVGHSGDANEAGPAGLRVYGQADGSWPATGDVWPQQDYQLTNQTRDGQVDGTVPSWLAGGSVDSRPAEGPIVPAEQRPWLDVGLVLVDRIGGCDGLSLSIQVQNAGTVAVPAGRTLEITAVEAAVLGEVTGRVVRTVTLPEIPPGIVLAALQVDLEADDVGASGVLLRIPHVGGVLECDVDDQEILVELACSP